MMIDVRDILQPDRSSLATIVLIVLLRQSSTALVINCKFSTVPIEGEPVSSVGAAAIAQRSDFHIVAVGVLLTYVSSAVQQRKYISISHRWPGSHLC